MVQNMRLHMRLTGHSKLCVFVCVCVLVTVIPKEYTDNNHSTVSFFTWYILFILILTSVNIMSGGGFQNRSELFHQLELTSIFFRAWKKDICELLRLLRKSSTLALYIFFPTLISSSVLFSSLWLTSLTRLGCLLIPPLILHCHPHVSSSILSENNAEEAWRRQPQRLKWLQKKKKE